MNMSLSTERELPSAVTWIVGLIALALLLLFLDLRDEAPSLPVIAGLQSAPGTVSLPQP